MARIWQNHKMATIGHKIFVEKNVKNPHKIEIFHKFHKKYFFLWKLKPLVYITNSAISTNTQFSKYFRAYKTQKVNWVFICGKRAKIDYYPRQITIVASTKKKPFLCICGRAAITNVYLILNLWKKCGRRKWCGIW